VKGVTPPNPPGSDKPGEKPQPPVQ